MDIRFSLVKYGSMPISTQALLVMLKGYRRPYDKIVELVKQDYLLQLKKGLYITTPKLSAATPEPFLIANHLYGPSYVSLDSALFYWGMIPEQVFEITSVTPKASRTMHAGNLSFSYTHLPITYYPFGFQSVELTQQQHALIASPEKCLFDKVVTTKGVQLRSKKQAISFLLEDLRIDKERLVSLNIDEMIKWLSVCPKKSSLSMMVKAIQSI